MPLAAVAALARNGKRILDFMIVKSIMLTVVAGLVDISTMKHLLALFV